MLFFFLKNAKKGFKGIKHFKKYSTEEMGKSFSWFKWLLFWNFVQSTNSFDYFKVTLMVYAFWAESFLNIQELEFVQDIFSLQKIIIYNNVRNFKFNIFFFWLSHLVIICNLEICKMNEQADHHQQNTSSMQFLSMSISVTLDQSTWTLWP